jgi:hypothetical protein
VTVDSYSLRGAAYTVAAYDSFGRMIAVSTGNTIDLSFCDNGIYYISIGREGKSSVKKRIVIMK